MTRRSLFTATLASLAAPFVRKQSHITLPARTHESDICGHFDLEGGEHSNHWPYILIGNGRESWIVHESVVSSFATYFTYNHPYLEPDPGRLLYYGEQPPPSGDPARWQYGHFLINTWCRHDPRA